MSSKIKLEVVIPFISVEATLECQLCLGKKTDREDLGAVLNPPRSTKLSF